MGSKFGKSSKPSGEATATAGGGGAAVSGGSAVKQIQAARQAAAQAAYMLSGIETQIDAQGKQVNESVEKLQLAKGDSGAMKTLGVAGNEIMRQLERLDQLTVPQGENELREKRKGLARKGNRYLDLAESNGFKMHGNWTGVSMSGAGIGRLARGAAVQSWTKHTREVLYPEICGTRLRLITPECELYRSDARSLPDGWGLPWWGFVWPGGWGVANHIVRHPELVHNRRTVLDLCAGCGIGAIAALRVGAASAVANDICEMACMAAEENAILNNVGSQLTTDSRNLIGSEAMSLQRGDVVLVGDALYDAGLAAELLPWLRDLATDGVDVYLGDPGRWVLTEMGPEERGRLMTSVATYTMPPILADEHHGITSVTVHKLLPF